MQFLIKVMVVLSCVVMTGCRSRIKTYTEEDAKEYANSKTMNSKMISMKQQNGDTIWTFKENAERGLSWQVIDNHYYMDSASYIETNELVSNYDAMVISYYADQYADKQFEEPVDYTYLNDVPLVAMLTYNVNNRAELEEAFANLEGFMQYVQKENASYSDNEGAVYDAMVFFVCGKYMDTQHTSALDEDLLIKNYIRSGLIYLDESILSDFSEEEIESYQTEFASNIFYRSEGEEEWMDAGCITDGHNLAIASNILYDLIKDGNDETLVIEGDRDAYTVFIDGTEYGTYQDELVTFFDAQNISGLSFRAQWQIQENDKEEEN